MTLQQDEFDAVLAIWTEPPLGDPPGHPPVGTGPDDPAPDRARVLHSDLEGMTVGIIYRSADGAPSERTIRCHLLEEKDGVLYVRAHCKLRNAARTFRFDRISAVVDYTTGEVIEDVEDFFGPFIADLREARVKVRMSKPARRRLAEGPMLQLYGDGAIVLAFIAASDGHIHEAEMQRIERFVDLRLAPMDGDRVQRDLSRTWLRNLLPTKEMAAKAMRKVAAEPDQAALVAEALIDLISVDGVVTDEEMVASRAMIDILARKEKKMARGTGTN